jgi:hypothetical protein
MGHIPLCLCQRITNQPDLRKRPEVIKSEQLDKIKKILAELKATEKCCGACGQFFNKQQADKEGFHLAIFCDAADELCEICNARVTICTCQRCLECGTLYSESDAVALLDDENNCANCANESGE